MFLASKWTLGQISRWDVRLGPTCREVSDQIYDLAAASGSMEPTIPIGSQVVGERVQTKEELAEIEVGEIISFMSKPDDPPVVAHRVVAHRVVAHRVVAHRVVAHRVVARSVRVDGGTVSTTRGEANNADDPRTDRLQQIRGVSQYHVP